MFFWNSLAFSMIQRMFAIWSLVPLPFLPSQNIFVSSSVKYIHIVVPQISRTFLSCETENSVPIKHYFLFPLPPALFRLSVSWFLSTLETSRQWKQAVFALSRLVYLTEHSVLKDHPCCSMYQNLLPFQGRIIFHASHFVYAIINHPSADTGAVSTSWLLSTILLWSWVYISLQGPAVNSFVLNTQKRNCGIIIFKFFEDPSYCVP